MLLLLLLLLHPFQLFWVVTWCLRTYIGLRPYMVNVYIKERIRSNHYMRRGVTSNTTYLGFSVVITLITISNFSISHFPFPVLVTSGS